MYNIYTKVRYIISYSWSHDHESLHWKLGHKRRTLRSRQTSHKSTEVVPLTQISLSPQNQNTPHMCHSMSTNKCTALFVSDNEEPTKYDINVVRVQEQLAAAKKLQQKQAEQWSVGTREGEPVSFVSPSKSPPGSSSQIGCGTRDIQNGTSSRVPQSWTWSGHLEPLWKQRGPWKWHSLYGDSLQPACSLTYPIYCHPQVCMWNSRQSLSD